MKKAVLFFGLVLGVSMLTSCTTDDFQSEIAAPNAKFAQENNYEMFGKEGDSLMVTDPIIIPKKD
jgi:hypothetical protein